MPKKVLQNVGFGNLKTDRNRNSKPDTIVIIYGINKMVIPPYGIACNISGPNYGRFLDVSFNFWKDFNISFKPNEDDADYQLHIKPFADLQNAFKFAFQENLSLEDSIGLHAKYIRRVTLTVNDIFVTLKLLEKLKNKYIQNDVTKNIFVHIMIDGGSINQFLIMMGFNNYVDYCKSENLQEDVAEIENSLKIKIVTAISSETLIYRADLFVINK